MNAACTPVRVEVAALAALEAEAGDTARACLCAAEAQHFDAMKAPLRRRQFLAGHWLARRMAVQAYGGSIVDWVWYEREDGRRELRAGERQCFVSLSHCEEWIACAICEAPVGIDIELPRRPRDYVALARHAFAPEQCEKVERAVGQEREACFLRFWTQKEARIKFDGSSAGLKLEHAEDVSTWKFERGFVSLCAPRNMMIRGLEDKEPS